MRRKTWIDPIPTLAAMCLAAFVGVLLMLLIGFSDVFAPAAEFFMWLPIILAPSIASLLLLTLVRSATNAEPRKYYGAVSVLFVLVMAAGIFVFPDVHWGTFVFNMAVFVVMCFITLYAVKQQR